MSRTTSTRTVVLASSGNLAIYGDSLPLYVAPTGPIGRPNSDSVVLVAPGQYVFYNTDTKVSTNTPTKTLDPHIKIGVGVDLNGDGTSDYIRWVSEGFSGCSEVNHDGKPSVCGVGTIKSLFGGCVTCGVTYGFEVVVYNPETEAFGYPGLGYTYSFSYTLPCGPCGTPDCTDTGSVNEVMCGLYNKIKGIEVNPNWDIKLNNFPLARDHTYLFDVALLYKTQAGAVVGDTTYEYCFTEGDGTCENCVNLTPGVSGVNWDALEAAITFSPILYTAGTPATSTRAQLQRLANAITVALDGQGSAVYLPPTGNCCTNHKIEVNTCLVGFELLDATETPDPIVPCADTNPFTDVTNYVECQGCDAVNTTSSFDAGLRFYAKAVQGECQCLPGNKALAEYFAELEVYPKFGWEPNGGAIVTTSQTSTLSEGQGFQWQAKELESLRYFTTEVFTEGNFGGKYGYPEENDALNHVLTNCRDSYCVISQVIGDEARHAIAGNSHRPWVTAYYLIPKGDATTIASFVAAFNTYFSGGICGLPVVSCA